MKDIIHVHIYEPHKGSLFGRTPKNTKSELHIYSCEHKSECDAFKKGMCINISNPFGAKCPVGKKTISCGFSQRARKYHETIKQWKETYKEFYHVLDRAPKRVTKVFGGWMLPYAHIAMNPHVPFKGKSGFFVTGVPFLHDEKMTSEIMDSIISFRPQALMGGEIKSYQEKVVPKFLHDFSENYPDIFTKLLGKNKIALARLENLNFVGRKAYLKTIKAGEQVTLASDIWEWDGEKIYRKDNKFAIFEPCEWVSCYAEYIPDDKSTVKITNNEQVDAGTVFAD